MRAPALSPSTVVYPQKNNSHLVDLYLRLSVDREGKDSLARQQADLENWAASRGLTVRNVWRDNGKSGYKRGVRRPDFDSAVAAVRAGEVGTLAIWKLDRLTRQGAGQIGTLLDDVDAVGGRLFFLKDSLDTSVSNSRMLIVMVSEQARSESANTSLRVRAKKDVQRKQGLYLGGRRPFGYVVGNGGDPARGIPPVLEDAPNDRKLRRHPIEAPLVREAFDRLMKGETMLAVCRDWNARGIPTRFGGAHWRSSAMSTTFRSPTLAGLAPDHRERETGYEGADIHPWRDPDTGQTVSLMAEGASPIVTEGERMALLTELDSRLRRYGRGMRATKQPQSLLGAGLVVCAECRRTCNSFGNAYRCRKVAYVGDTCARPLSVSLGTLEEAVKQRWAFRIASLEPDDPLLGVIAERWLAQNDPAPMREREELSEHLSTLEARLSEADRDRYVRNALPAERHALITAELTKQIARVQTDLAALPKPTADLGALLDPEISLPAIMAAPVLEARALLRLAIDKVIVTPAPYSGARFHAHERLQIVWADEDTDAAEVRARVGVGESGN
ncbi:recombinase family protein [Microbacterium wangruii]|uniref:recombinase family protein n=1 Tax=Microbacterium wangruii TaxID=3049073 RepID=UPI00256EE303|nr:recombinase family protein [Microbacterium sp. zg-Y1211]MDL5487719.1 recombinase family protein [Microbacterium sp. zg-Y1211]